MGKARYEAEIATEKSTSNNAFGPRVTGRKLPPAAPPVTVDPAMTVQGTLERIKAGGDLAPLIEGELTRAEPRATVIKALMQAGAKRGLPPEVLDRLAESLTPKG
ncbi:MAG TPA: hypothetical protein VM487_12055 [Phycisphaerae bacterium]|nr:hypothetical protein [Phycisphaerae bacterium]